MNSAELLVIGAGLVGLATAYHYLLDNPGSTVIVLEKESDVASHQSSHNGGVLHSGLLWSPRTLKAEHVRYGKGMLRSFCERENIDYAIYGKLVVATDSAELADLESLYRQGVANGVDCRLIDANRLRKLEPHAAGIAAIHVEQAGIVDYRAVARHLALRIEMMGGHILTNHRAVGAVERPEAIIVRTETDSYVAERLVNAAGLHADRVARWLDVASDVKVVPFRGEYYRLSDRASQFINSQIFPVPDLDLPFTGIHLVRQLDGSVLCGPNAIMAGGREGYRKGQISLRDALDQATSRRVRRLTRQHFATAMWEQRRSWSKELFALTLQRLVPAITTADLQPAPAGVSVYALSPDGTLSADFEVSTTPRSTHVLSAPTPGATASLSLGRMLASPENA